MGRNELEDVCEQVLFAAKQAVRYILLQLPCTAKPFLDRERIRKLAYLLKLVDANNDALLLLFRNIFGQFQNLLRSVFLRSDTQRKRKIRRRIRPHADFRRNPAQKILRILQDRINL
mgnify:CR=1 FL=1